MTLWLQTMNIKKKKQLTIEKKCSETWKNKTDKD